MIKSLHAGHLPAFVCQPGALAKTANPTLTEVACLAIYGAPLKPDEIASRWRDIQLEHRILWRREGGPRWIRDGLSVVGNEELQAGTFPELDEAEAGDVPLLAFETFDSELAWKYGPSIWLKRWRLQPPDTSLSDELAAKVRRLNQMSDEQARDYAAAEAERIECIQSEVNALSASFYEALSEAVTSKHLQLPAISADPQTGAWIDVRPGEAPHRPIPTGYFDLDLCHDLFVNELEADRTSPELRTFDAILDRLERENAGQLVKWIDVKLPLEDARQLLARLGMDLGTAGDRAFQSRPTNEEADWNPAWLSLASAIMWVVTRDKRLTRWIDLQTNNDRRIQSLIQITLSGEQVFEGHRVEQIVQVADAWPALRRLIADEKIAAEGKSLERRGINSDVETRFPNQRIPSGDAGSLRFYDNVPGIKPKSALGPDELYTLHNWHGRYWYDVRLRAADVFACFEETSSKASAESLGKKEGNSEGGKGPGPTSLIDAIIEADKELWPDGPPKGTTAKARRAKIREHNSTLKHVSDKTFQRAGIGKN